MYTFDMSSVLGGMVGTVLVFAGMALWRRLHKWLSARKDLARRMAQQEKARLRKQQVKEMKQTERLS